MATDLTGAAIVAAYKRELLGLDITALTDADIALHLGDGFSDGLLEGLFVGKTLTTPTSVDVTLTAIEERIVVVLAAMKFLFLDLLQRNTRFRAHAGPAEYETEQSANLLVRIIDQLTIRKAHLLELYGTSTSSTSVYYIDGVSAREAIYSTVPGQFPPA